MTHEQMIEAMSAIPQAGDTLANGWTVIEAYTCEGSEAVLVMAVTNNAETSAHPYATWFAREQDGGWETYWGDYCLTIDDALVSFKSRSGIIDERTQTNNL
jgi:hypothetical protein